MKCVKNKQTGEIKRLEIYLADRLIKSGEWMFVRKEEWKAYKKNNQEQK